MEIVQNIKEKFCFLEQAKNIDEVNKYLEKYLQEKYNNIIRKKILPIVLGKMRFAICVVENNKKNKEILLIKTKNKLCYGKIESEELLEDFNTDLCFYVFLSYGEKYEFVVESLLERIIRNMHVYLTL